MNKPSFSIAPDTAAYHRPQVYLESLLSDVTTEVVECFGIALVFF